MEKDGNCIDSIILDGINYDEYKKIVEIIVKNIMNWKDRVKSMNLNIIKDNIIDLSVDVEAIVNSANPFMSKGGGVCGAIHEAGGAEFTEYCIRQGGLRTDSVK